MIEKKINFELFQIHSLLPHLNACIISICHKLESDPKEINVYRSYELMALVVKLYKKTLLPKKNIVQIKFNIKELLALRYFFIDRNLCQEIEFYNLYKTIDETIHPNLFTR